MEYKLMRWAYPPTARLEDKINKLATMGWMLARITPVSLCTGQSGFKDEVELLVVMRRRARDEFQLANLIPATETISIPAEEQG